MSISTRPAGAADRGEQAAAIVGLADDLDLRRARAPPQPAVDQRVVIDEQQPDHSGRVARRTKSPRVRPAVELAAGQRAPLGEADKPVPGPVGCGPTPRWPQAHVSRLPVKRKVENRGQVALLVPEATWRTGSA